MKQPVAHALMAAVLVMPLPVAAQMRSPGFVGVPQHSVTLSFGSPQRLPNRFLHPAVFWGGPLWYPDYAQPPLPPPEVVVVEVPSAAREIIKDEHSSVHPLLIEWQDNRFVRVTSGGETPNNGRVASNHGAESNPGSNSPAAARELPPALLIFRDGHREETANYAIADGVLYAYPDYWTGGAWAKRILVSDLDLPATLQQNQQRGVKFILPAGPNQVVTRP